MEKDGSHGEGDRNRACILSGRGKRGGKLGAAIHAGYLKMLKDCVLTMDATRLVTYAMNPHFKRESKCGSARKSSDIQKFVDEADDSENLRRRDESSGNGLVVDREIWMGIL